MKTVHAASGLTTTKPASTPTPTPTRPKPPNHRRFNAFFRFSIPAGTFAAPRFGAFAAAVESPTGLEAATFESAVPSGDGDVRRSFVPVLSDRVELDVERVLEAEDLRGCVGTEADVSGRDLAVVLATSVGTGATADAPDAVVVLRGSEDPDDPASGSAVLNSGGGVYSQTRCQRHKHGDREEYDAPWEYNGHL